MHKNYWQKQRLVSLTKQIKIGKKFFIILEIKCDYLQKILVLINFLKSSMIKWLAFLKSWENISLELQLFQAMKIHIIFHTNLL